MTGFAVTIWVYEGTEKATALPLTGFFFITPLLLFSPLAGAIVDRYDRKLMMMVSDLAAGVTTIVVLLLHVAGHLEVWHLFVTNAINGAFQTFQWPAFSAAIPLMLPKEQYGRANGMMQLAGSGSQIFAPVLAGALLVPLGLTGILLLDIFTFVFAIGALLFVHVPHPEETAAGRQRRGSIWAESLYGFQYILERPSLFCLQLGRCHRWGDRRGGNGRVGWAQAPYTRRLDRLGHRRSDAVGERRRPKPADMGCGGFCW